MACDRCDARPPRERPRRGCAGGRGSLRPITPHIGLRAEDPTIATALKQQGYATGQFGKNHLGDRDEFLPTAHGFDEFFGNLYHLNAEEEPELPDYPTEEEFPEFRKRFGPRGVIRSWANGDGTQKIEDTRAPHQEADGDLRRGVPRRRGRFHPAPGRSGHALLRVVQHHPHALPHAHEAGEQGTRGAVAVSAHI
jgi:arylsulfatase A-like enzyme